MTTMLLNQNPAVADSLRRNATHISIRRPLWNVVEYDITCGRVHGEDADGNPVSMPDVRTFHANRSATFHGPHTGLGDGRQVMGCASSPWCEDDNQMLRKFRRFYPYAELNMD